MGKNRDVIQILLIVILGMFIPFVGSIAINYGMNLTLFDDWYKISSTFGYFLLIFGIELLAVYVYYNVSNKIATKRLEKFNESKRKK